MMLALSAMLVVAGSAHAGWVYWVAPAYPACYPIRVAYFYPAFVYPLPVTVMPLATPTPAPPSTAPSPYKAQMPSADKSAHAPAMSSAGPSVVESRTSSGTADSPDTRFRVGFWNLSGKDVTLVIDGRPHSLARDRALTLELPRVFSWQVDQEAAQQGRVPEGKTAMELVIR
jgi:hypothetical protein